MSGNGDTAEGKRDTRTGERGDTERITDPSPSGSFSPSPRVPASPGLSFSVSPRLFLLFIVALVLLYGVIYPNIHVVLASFQQNGNWSVANYVQALSQPIVLESIVASVGVSILTVLMCAAVGIPLAFLFERYSFPARRVFAALAALPLVLPPLVGTVAFIFLCGESGILARFVQYAFDLDHSPWSLRGWPALILSHTSTMSPFRSQPPL